MYEERWNKQALLQKIDLLKRKEETGALEQGEIRKLLEARRDINPIYKREDSPGDRELDGSG